MQQTRKQPPTKKHSNENNEILKEIQNPRDNMKTGTKEKIEKTSKENVSSKENEKAVDIEKNKSSSYDF